MKYILFLFFLLGHFESRAQSVLFGKFTDHVEGLISLLPGSAGSQYQDPSSEDLVKWEEVIRLIISDEIEEAHIKSESIGYEIIKFIDNTLSKNQEFIVLQKLSSGNNFWGSFIYNANSCRNLVIQCPHPRVDTNTGLQGAHIFTRINTRALMISGTHRCNNPIPSGCSGNTSVCGSSSPYRKSDIAHNSKSIFQLTTEVLSEDAALLFIQLHGFSKSSSDPNLIISNGTRSTPEMDPILSLKEGLLQVNDALTFKIIHIDSDWTKLTAFTNTQGRFLNESSSSCSQNASNSNGRFIHIEQEFDLFRRNVEGWDLMLQGMSIAYECLSSNVHEASKAEIYKLVDGQLMMSDDYKEVYRFELYNLEGRRIHGIIPPRNTIFCILIREIRSGSIIHSKKHYLN